MEGFRECRSREELSWLRLASANSPHPWARCRFRAHFCANQHRPAWVRFCKSLRTVCRPVRSPRVALLHPSETWFAARTGLYGGGTLNSQKCGLLFARLVLSFSSVGRKKKNAHNVSHMMNAPLLRRASSTELRFHVIRTPHRPGFWPSRRPTRRSFTGRFTLPRSPRLSRRTTIKPLASESYQQSGSVCGDTPHPGALVYVRSGFPSPAILKGKPSPFL